MPVRAQPVLDEREALRAAVKQDGQTRDADAAYRAGILDDDAAGR